MNVQKILDRLEVYKAHREPYESSMRSISEIRERMDKAESDVIAEFDAASMDTLIWNDEQMTVVTGADGKRFIVITKAGRAAEKLARTG